MHPSSRIRFILVIVLLISLSIEVLYIPQEAGATGNIIYVNANNNSGTYTGVSWATAYRRLQNALSNAASGDQIWVAASVYYPDEGPVQTNNDPASSFILINGVALYGGFSGVETLLSQRNIAANPTILSGDIEKDDTNTDGNFIAETPSDIQGNNAYHVVIGSGTDATAILDGFIITAGAADYPGSPTEVRSLGGGMYNSSGSPTLSNLTFSGNIAYQGGGMYNISSSPILTHVTFSENRADDAGGGMYNKTNSSPTLTDATFAHNLSFSDGGGMINLTDCNPTLTDVIFERNVADHPLFNSGNGGGMQNINSDPVLTNVTFTQNLTDAEGGGMSNFNSDTRLTNVIFYGNSAPLGAGVHDYKDINTGASVYTNTVFISNEGNQGGGMYLVRSNPLMSNITFYDNYALYNGGGMYISIYSSPVLTNVTFGENQAINSGGGIFTRAYSDPILTNVTINSNGSSDFGAGMYNTDHSVPLLRNSLIANNASKDCENDATSSLDPASANNLIEDSANACGLAHGVNGNIIGQDPNVGALQNNGGLGDTFALLPGSPAIDTGANGVCPATDQRGVTRPKDGNGDSTATCDMGAYEAEPVANLLVNKTNNVGGQALVGGQFVWKLQVLNNGLASAVFTNGQVILRDNLPTSGATYGATIVQNLVNITNGNNLSCSVSANTLTCSASGGSVTLGPGTGQFEVTVPVSPNVVGTLSNPRSGGICRADPNSLILESAENNNDCSANNVTVSIPVYLPVITR